jgi:hypothetical protein
MTMPTRDQIATRVAALEAAHLAAINPTDRMRRARLLDAARADLARADNAEGEHGNDH